MTTLTAAPSGVPSRSSMSRLSRMGTSRAPQKLRPRIRGFPASARVQGPDGHPTAPAYGPHMSAVPRILIAGGGVAALEAVLALLDRAPRLPVELVAADSHFVNRPLSVLEP